jgi:flavin-dependent dehydrogenase
MGAEVRRGVSVKRLDAEGLDTSDGPLAAERIILASGKHDVRGAGRESADADWGMVGFKAYFELEPAQRRALEGAVEIVMFEGGYAGLQLVEDGRANLCLLVREAHFAAAGRTWPDLYARLMTEPHLARRFAGAQASEPRPLAIARLPFGFLRRGSAGPGVYPVGDQAAVIPSFTGDGMAIALHSARLAARAAAAGAGPDRYLAQLRADLARPIGLAGWLQRRAETWPGRAATVAAFAAFPPLMAHLARATRVPSRALERAA